jgi:hypothetical protein
VTVDAIPLDTMQFTAQYELIRSQVINAARDAPHRYLGAQPRGVGIGLLLREGMPGWLGKIDSVIRASLSRWPMDAPLPKPAEPLAECSIGSPWFSGVQRQDITTLLTSLVLSTRLVDPSSPTEGYRSCQ